MLNAVLRFFSAIFLSLFTIIVVRFACVSCFGMTVFFFSEFSFRTMTTIGLISSIGGTILTVISGLLLAGLSWAGQGSKWIAVLPILLFLLSLLSDGVYLLNDSSYFGVNSETVKNILQEEAGGFYTIGAILTLLAELACFVVASVAILYKED